MRTRIHRYGDDPSQFGELYGEGPVAVLIHGGFCCLPIGKVIRCARIIRFRGPIASLIRAASNRPFF
jgi:hypothetical protein